MSAEVIVGIVGIVAAVGVGVWAALYGARKQREAQEAGQRAIEAGQRAAEAGQRAAEAEKTVEAVLKATQEQLLKRIGYKFDRTYAKLELLDLDGTCKVTRFWYGAKVTDDLMKLPHLRSTLSFDTPKSALIKSPQLTEAVKFPRRTELKFKIIGDGQPRCDVFLEIAGSLTNQDPELRYGYEYVVSNAFLMSREEVFESYNKDFIQDEAFSLIEDAVYALEIEIVFPPDFQVDVQLGVKLRNLDVLHQPEYDRLKKCRKEIPKGYSFLIEQPLIACDYFIHWWPPAAPKPIAPKPVDAKDGRSVD